MSHSLHRFGTEDNLRNDFCIYTRAAKGINRENCGDKLRETLKIYLSENVVNFGSSHAGRCFLNGLDPEEYAKTLDHSYGIIATFADREAVKGVLVKAKEAQLGISTVVSGLIEEVVEIAHEAGLKPHTALISLGIHGKTSMLPENEVLEFTTMCGHSLVAQNLVRSVIEKVKGGKLTPEEGALILAKPCTCGIFNTRRCAALMKEKLEKETRK
ncbi:hypothetical protein [Aminiphilus circumscriptus]|jgi:hypothetical protein|uniref:hypothetical protein n=1 Tax=Aminiphilus circumscriptus TaxID=290732 RepID=UPI000492A2F3|nr:hypothetical protein [Aminiphilus circumscriptus]